MINMLTKNASTDKVATIILIIIYGTSYFGWHFLFVTVVQQCLLNLSPFTNVHSPLHLRCVNQFCHSTL